MIKDRDKNILSVSEYIAVLNQALKQVSGQVSGEITGLTKTKKGHLYYSLKDEKTNDVLPCMMWGYDHDLNGFELENGMEVLIKGTPTFYGPFGKFSFQSKTVELLGEGALKRSYEKLKARLKKEGLFAPENKKPLPLYPEKIGVITSVKGAVIHDFNNNLKKHGFKVKIMDTRVEGHESGRDLIHSLRAFKREDIEVLVIIRGGGSMQSLAGFDNEVLVREVANFPVPVIAGIGHHQDVTLSALAADSSVSTPSIAAGLINQSWQEARHSVQTQEQLIFNTFESKLNLIEGQISKTFLVAKGVFEDIFDSYTSAKHIIEQNFVKIKYSLLEAGKTIASQLKHISELYAQSLKEVRLVRLPKKTKEIMGAFNLSLADYDNQLKNFGRIIEMSSPERQLRLGYSLTKLNGKVIRDASNINLGDELETQFYKGKVSSHVKKIN